MSDWQTCRWVTGNGENVSAAVLVPLYQLAFQTVHMIKLFGMFMH
jgi:hypothetical protein